MQTVRLTFCWTILLLAGCRYDRPYGGVTSNEPARSSAVAQPTSGFAAVATADPARVGAPIEAVPIEQQAANLRAGDASWTNHNDPIMRVGSTTSADPNSDRSTTLMKPVSMSKVVEKDPIAEPVAAAAMQIEPVPQLALLDAVELGLAQNPDLEVVRQAEGVNLAALGVARTYPFNPFVQIQVTPSQHNPAGNPSAVGHYVLLMQTVQLAHQRRHRESGASAALNSVRWNVVQAEMQNVAQTQRLFGTAQYQKGLWELAQENAVRNDELLAISERQLQAGQLAGADVAIVRLDAQAARQQTRLAEANYQTALNDLRRHLNVPLAQRFDVRGSLSDWQWLPTATGAAQHRGATFDALLETTPTQQAPQFAASRPDVLAAQSDVAAARANENLARANRVPDLQIGPYYQRDDQNTTFWGLRAQQDVPIWNNGKPLVRQRNAELQQRCVAYEQALARATREAEVALDRYERARQTLVRESSLAQIPIELQRLEVQFKANEIDLLRVTTARTSLLQLRRAQLDCLNELAQAAAAVTAATGLPPQALIENARIEP